MVLRNRYDKDGNLLPSDYQVEELPKDLYELLGEVYQRRLQKQEDAGISTNEKSA